MGGEKRHYYGYTDYNMGQTTSTSNNSVLKMDGGIVSFKEPKDARYGTDFALELDDGTEALRGASWEFTAKGAASLVGDGKAPDTVYYCESGADGAWTKGSNKTLGFVYKRTWDDKTTFDHFKGLSIDGKPVSTEGYEARRGSVAVDLLPLYLEALDTGGHTLTAEFDDGDAVAVAFTVKEASSSGGGESSNVPSGGGDETSGNATNSPSVNGGVSGLMGGSASRTATPQTGDYATPALFVALVLGIIGTVLCVLSRRFT